ncbi:unnamed protein product [Closterium sp. Naga37s-1]|nr:unnamed protein product [Closterium sp. Naga37s-1]
MARSKQRGRQSTEAALSAGGDGATPILLFRIVIPEVREDTGEALVAVDSPRLAILARRDLRNPNLPSCVLLSVCPCSPNRAPEEIVADRLVSVKWAAAAVLFLFFGCPIFLPAPPTDCQYLAPLLPPSASASPPSALPPPSPLHHCAMGYAATAGVVGGGRPGAARYVVTVADDAIEGAPEGSLRWAVANLGGGTGGRGERQGLYVTFNRSMTIRLKSRLFLASHTTIDGRGVRVRLLGNGLVLQNVTNVIIHNIEIGNQPGDHDVLPIRSSQVVWIDHCHVYNGHRGTVDIVYNSTDVTISNCRIHNHRLTMLLGADDSHEYDRNMRVTVMASRGGATPSKGCLQRLQREMKLITKEPPPHIRARPNPADMLDWHFVLEGSPGTPYEGGWYHGRLRFPADYPFKPPSIMMLTPNGRFATSTRICMSMSDFHPETWNPMWSVASILTGLLSFMSDDAVTAGSIVASEADRRKLARLSMPNNCRSPVFRKLFPDLVDSYTASLASAAEAAEGWADGASRAQGEGAEGRGKGRRVVEAAAGVVGGREGKGSEGGRELRVGGQGGAERKEGGHRRVGRTGGKVGAAVPFSAGKAVEAGAAGSGSASGKQQPGLSSLSFWVTAAVVLLCGPSAQLSHALTRIHAAMHRPSSPAPAPPSSPPRAGSPPDDATRRFASRRASQERTAELLQQSFRPKVLPSAPAHARAPIPGLPDGVGGSERRRGAMRSSSGPREGRFGGGPPRGTESPTAPGRATLRKQLSSDIAPLLLRLKRQATPTRVRSQSPVLSPVQSPRDVWEAAEAGKLFDWTSRDTECTTASPGGSAMADEVSLAEQEARLKKKYGGALPKKKGLLSKGHERAFFDSAEWAIQKQKGAKPAAPAEQGLQPKLEVRGRSSLPHINLPRVVAPDWLKMTRDVGLALALCTCPWQQGADQVLHQPVERDFFCSTHDPHVLPMA